jgi:hypothetical protein
VSLSCLKSDKRRSRLCTHWERWLTEADKLYAVHLRELDESPFAYHEVAAVGFLTSAAARAGFLTLNEYEIEKTRRTGQRGRPPGYQGRADLWMRRNGLDYSFEFKRALYAATSKNLSKVLSIVRQDIAAVPADECHYAAAGLIAYAKYADRDRTYVDFCDHDDVHFAYRIGPTRHRGAYIYFWIKDQ